jgi:hypothetical protein
MRMRRTALTLLLVATVACRQTPHTTEWQTGPPLVLARSSACAATADNHIYVVGGGWTDAATALTTVEYAVIGPGGRLSDWHLTARMATPRVFLGCVAMNGYLYAIGGERFTELQPMLLPSVERAPILPDGNLGLWEPVESLTTPRRAPVAIAADRAIYVIGGYNGTFLRTIERASLLPDGTLGPWRLLEQTTTMPRYIHAGVRNGNDLYLLGGHDESTGMATNRTEWTRILPTGELAPWKEGPTLSSPRFLTAAAIANHHLYLIGGSTGRQALGTVEASPIQSDGSLGAFSPAGTLTAARSGAAIAAHDLMLYLIGGLIENHAVPTVEYATVAP